MPSKPIELTPEVARAFSKDLRAYHATRNKDKRTQIAARQAEVLSRETGASVSMEEVYELFRKMRDAVLRCQ